MCARWDLSGDVPMDGSPQATELAHGFQRSSGTGPVPLLICLDVDEMWPGELLSAGVAPEAPPPGPIPPSQLISPDVLSPLPFPSSRSPLFCVTEHLAVLQIHHTPEFFAPLHMLFPCPESQPLILLPPPPEKSYSSSRTQLKRRHLTTEGAVSPCPGWSSALPP